ncbi:MAG: ATP-binding cassette domain-containing protein [Rhodobacteraceae bacterium]|nr:ATP-binding cassette domain-containing protein [Paracoccaceae bacterium]
MSNVLELKGLTKTYFEGKPNEIKVLSGANLTLKAGEVVGLIAPSGAGKSTLLQIAGLLDNPTSGQVIIAGNAAEKAKDKERTRLRREQIGFIYQFHHLLPEFSAEENIALPQQANGVSHADATARARMLLDRVGLSARYDHRPAELSGGEQQRVAFCRALANGPSLLLADEPTGNLDPETSETVFTALMELVRETGLSALIATHNHELAARMDRVIQLSGGKIEPV